MIGFTGIFQWVVVLFIALLLFGGSGKIAKMMGDLGEGLRAFKKNLSAPEEDDKEDDPKSLADKASSDDKSGEPAKKA